MGEKSQNTNLASEFYVLSMLYRLGANAHLTLGNKKSVDIVVEKKSTNLTIDVKGLKGTTGWPVDNIKNAKENHYYVFVSFLNKISDFHTQPEVYIVPSKRLSRFIYHSRKGRRIVQVSRMRKTGTEYLNKWALIK